MVHELFFDVSLSGFFAEARAVLARDRPKSPATAGCAESESHERSNHIHAANEQRRAELSTNPRHACGELGAENAPMERFSPPTRYELKSPPLSSVQEELASNENLLANDQQKRGEAASAIKTLDSLKLSYKENKFPIRARGDPRNNTK